MTGHVGVDPDPLVLPLPVHHVRVGHVVLVVAPDDVIYRSLVQHRHHPNTLQYLFNNICVFKIQSLLSITCHLTFNKYSFITSSHINQD